MKANYEEEYNKNTYSLQEQKIGKWIDGKPIYRKVIQISNSNDLATGISNIDNMVRMECVTLASGGWRNIPWIFTMNNTIGSNSWAGGFYFRTSDKKIVFQVGSDLGNFTKGFVILEYTKQEV